MKYSVLIAIIFILSCSDKKELELTFLNDSLVSYVPKDTIHNRITIGRQHYKKISNNIITFKIHNKSKDTYLLIFDNKYGNCYPDSFRAIGFQNLIFSDKDGNSPIYSNTTATAEELHYNFLDYQDSVQKTYYDNIGYDNKLDSWKKKSAKISKSIITIHPDESVYFETYTSLPQKKDDLIGDYSGVSFDTAKKFEAKLRFTFLGYDDVKDFLTEIKKKEIKENGYKVYNGTLESTNSVPVNFIKK
ncbi:hypothetical protein [uncultured Winogradskyella sp.]|uniref:hypothetical protein n=1 Tax=uncultured Winogradskyella sp. TaxID=395353 RepID=UPI002634B01F|nr:hypothetical protein [uncultured Winogradskyella sp.]